MVRISNQNHRDVNVMAGDTVILSCTPIPGNEPGVSKTIDNLLRQGATVLYDRIAMVHVHGHASQEELKMVLNLVKPRYFVPVHGEYRHLMAHAQLAWDLGIAQGGIFVLEDGDVLQLNEETASVVESVSAGPIYIDGLTTHDQASEVLSQRRALSKDGVVVIVVATDKETGRLTAEPKAVASGFMDDSDTNGLFQELNSALGQEINASGGLVGEPEEMKSKVKETARKFLAAETNRRPIIIPVVLEGR
jgi:ribonuclease J